MTKFLIFAAVFAASVLMMLAGGGNPIEQTNAKYHAWQTERQAETLEKAKQDAWARYVDVNADCQKPKSALKELECRNRLDMQRKNFERQWANKLASGWLPRELK